MRKHLHCKELQGVLFALLPIDRESVHHWAPDGNRSLTSVR